MTEEKKTEEIKKESPEEVKVDIPEDKKDDVATKTQEEAEKGKRPEVMKGGGRPTGGRPTGGRPTSGRPGGRPGGRRDGGRPGGRRDQYQEPEWDPKTKLGTLVKTGKITSMHGALHSGLPLREPQIVDSLIGEELVDEVLKVNMVQRMTDSGRRTRFSITVVVGNGNGYVGLGSARGKEVGPTIKKAIDNAKLHMIELTRGCGSWECGCMTPHSLPYQVNGKAGSTLVRLNPAPRGVGLAVGDVAKKILKLAGIKDAWGFSRGQTKTTVNNAKAVMDAIKGTTLMRVQKGQSIELKHHRGQIIGEKEVLVEEGGDQ